MERDYTILESEYTVPVEEILADCVDVPKFLALCKACPNYGNRWSCPPYQGNMYFVWMAYDELQLVIRMVKPSPGMTEEEALRMVDRERAAFSAELLRREKEIPDAMSLAAGPCTKCGDNCTRRIGGICRMPQELRYSIESIGGDVSKLTERYFGKSLLWIENGVLPEYFLLAGGFLKKKDRLNIGLSIYAEL